MLKLMCMINNPNKETNPTFRDQMIVKQNVGSS